MKTASEMMAGELRRLARWIHDDGAEARHRDRSDELVRTRQALTAADIVADKIREERKEHMAFLENALAMLEETSRKRGEEIIRLRRKLGEVAPTRLVVKRKG